MKKIVVLVLLLALLMPLFAGAQQEKAAKKTMVTFLMPTKEQPIWLFQGDELVKLFQEKGYETRLEYAEDLIERQVYQIENATLLGTKYLVISAVDSYSISDAVEKARADGVKIIANDRLIMNTSAVDFYVTFDLYRLGEMQGQYIEKALGLDKGAKGPFNMEIVSGSPDDPNSQLFYGGAMSVLQKYIDAGSLRILSGQVAFNVTATPGWDTAKAMARVDNLLGAYYTKDPIHAVLSAADTLTIGVISALTSMGYGTSDRPFPVVTGQDAELAAMKSIIDGKQAMTVFLDAVVLAQKTFEVVDGFEKGTPVKPDAFYNNDMIEVPTALYDPVPVDKDNWRIVIDRGLYTEADFR
jgi:putative multiple sugar transport system substrate-binding protein